MERKAVEKQYQQITGLVASGQLRAAISRLTVFARLLTQDSLLYMIESIAENYRNLLKYAFEGYRDPERDNILAGISAEILTLADEIRYRLSDQELFHRRVETVAIRQEYSDDPDLIAQKLEDFLITLEIQRMATETGTQTVSVSFDSLFRLIWLTRKLPESQAEVYRKMIRSDRLEWHEKCLIISALTLSLLSYFDPKKFNLLLDAIDQRELQVYQRALSGLIFSLIRYDNRIRFYPVLTGRISLLRSDESVWQDAEAVVMQLLMAQETEKITQAFREEVLPDMEKVMPKMEDKLQLDTIFEEDDPDGKNPGWKDLIDEVPGLFERIEKFTKMQMEGGDVFMATFSMLKRFEFFNRMSNWFTPFFPGHPELNSGSDGEEHYFDRLTLGLSRAFYLCNSDKYSFALNFNAVPQQQRSMIITYFEAELEQMKEMATEEEILGQTQSSHTLFIQYIQDLYRFFKLYPHHEEFEDIFGRKIRFQELWFYRNLFEREAFADQIVTFYFEKEHYPEAADLYQYILEHYPQQAVHYEKLGYALQKTGNLAAAIEAYKKAELFDTNRFWLLNKLGWCSLKLGNYRDGGRYYSDAVEIRPDDLKIKVQLGQCYLNLGEFETALHHYSKVRYFQPDNIKVLRPIAYCLLMLDRLTEAGELYDSILSSGNASGYDFLNAGHAALCSGERSLALERYRNCLTDASFSDATLVAAFREDAPLLDRHGITFGEQQLLTDYILMDRS